jgi:hypothetical protein
MEPLQLMVIDDKVSFLTGCFTAVLCALLRTAASESLAGFFL